jgi:predicted dithiol-disulfide oxidoreductase (DUF899 family)
MSDQPQAEQAVPHPQIVAAEEWLAARVALLEQEKELTRQSDRVNALRRRLPMVKLEKPYEFEGPEGKVSLQDVFAGQRQLIVYHFMFGPEQEAGCPGCTGFVDSLGDLSLLDKRDTRFVLVSRAPLAKLEAYRAQHGWDVPWYSSFGSDFNYDFHVSFSPESMAKDNTYNFRERTSHGAGESHGLSVYFRLGDDVYHTYSAYARGVENLVHSYTLLDVTPYGRQEDFEDSPPGWPQQPTYG